MWVEQSEFSETFASSVLYSSETGHKVLLPEQPALYFLHRKHYSVLCILLDKEKQKSEY